MSLCVCARSVHAYKHKYICNKYIYTKVRTRLRPLAQDADVGAGGGAPCCRRGAHRTLWTHLAVTHCCDPPSSDLGGRAAGSHSSPF